jgi:hypothetical protein
MKRILAPEQFAFVVLAALPLTLIAGATARTASAVMALLDPAH